MDDKTLTWIRGPGGNPGHLFRLAHQAWRSAMEEALRPYRLSVPQYGALSMFDVTDEASSVELARITAVTPQSMNSVVHQLVARSLLDRRPGHGKVVVLRLTPSGRNLLDEATIDVRAVEQVLLDGLDAREAATVRGWLVDVPSRLESIRRQPHP